MAKHHNPVKIIKVGDDSSCVHREIIRDDIGTCMRCGQVRQYSDGADYDRSLQRDFSFQAENYWDRVSRNTDIGVKTW